MTTDDRLEAEVDSLRARSPQQFGLLQRHHTALKTALDDAEQNYPTSRQLHEGLDDPSLSSRTFGKTLPLLVEFDIISLYTDRSSANRYDIQEYDADRLERLGDILLSTPE